MNNIHRLISALALMALIWPAGQAIEAPGLPTRNVIAEAQCPWENDSSGMWGKTGSCTFDCPGPAGEVNGNVDADDRDAKVSVTGSCGPHDTHCSDEDACTARPVAYSGTYMGECTGSSDEIFDDGLYINCWANVQDDPATSECIIRDPICIERPVLRIPDVSEPTLPEVVPPSVPNLPRLPKAPAIDLDAVLALACTMVDCEIVAPTMAGFFAPWPGSVIFASAAGSISFICPGGMQECTLATPTITQTATGLEWTI